MGADVSFDEEPITDEVRTQRAAERARLRAEFGRLSPEEREQRAEEFMERLRDLCPTARAFARSWNAGFEPLRSPR